MQISELKQRLDLLNSACDEVYNKLLLVFGAVHIFLRHILLMLLHQVRSSQKLKEIMKRIDYLGNTNQGPARGKTISLRSPGVAVGFKLKNLLKVGHTRGASSMQHLCKVNYNRK